MSKSSNYLNRGPDYLYTTWKGYLERCIYCGDWATTFDHVPPLCHAARLIELSPDELYATALIKVPSCDECNKLAGAIYHSHLNERRKYIKTKIRQKYKRILLVPPWSDEELAELGFNMRSHVTQLDTTYKKVRQRLAYQGPLTSKRQIRYVEATFLPALIGHRKIDESPPPSSLGSMATMQTSIVSRWM